jgi:ATP-binding cassette subfamily B multidrug efflux pump
MMPPQRTRPGVTARPPMMGPMRGGPMARGHMAAMGGEKARNFKDTMKTLVKYLRPYRSSIILVILLAMASTSFMIVGPKLLGNATTILFQGVTAKLMQVPGAAIDFPAILRLVLTLLGLSVVSRHEGHLRVTQEYRREDRPPAT